MTKPYVGEAAIIPHLTEDPFTHFAQEYIMAGNFRGTGGPPTLEVLTEAWEDLDAEQRAHYIIKAHNFVIEKAARQQQQAMMPQHDKWTDRRFRERGGCDGMQQGGGEEWGNQQGDAKKKRR